MKKSLIIVTVIEFLVCLIFSFRFGSEIEKHKTLTPTAFVDILIVLMAGGFLIRFIYMGIKDAKKEGRLDGFGKPKDPNDILENFDSIQILKCVETQVFLLCLVEVRDQIVYVRFAKELHGCHDVRERRFYRVRIEKGDAKLNDLHDEIARARA